MDRAAKKGTKTWLASCKLIAEEWVQQRLSPELLDEVKAKGELWVPADGQEGHLSSHCEFFILLIYYFPFFVFSSRVGEALRGVCNGPMMVQSFHSEHFTPLKDSTQLPESARKGSCQIHPEDMLARDPELHSAMGYAKNPQGALEGVLHLRFGCLATKVK